MPDALNYSTKAQDLNDLRETLGFALRMSVKLDNNFLRYLILMAETEANDISEIVRLS